MRNLFTIILLLASLMTFAQPAPVENNTAMLSGRVRGIIVDSGTQQPMEYANIAIYNMRDSSLVTGGITNQNGQFDISGLGFGVYYAEANFIGYEKVSLPEIRIIPSSQVVDIGKLTLSASTFEMAGIDVVADRQRIEYQIDKKVINVSQDINAAGGTAVDVLENTPSVEVDIDGNVSLRGSTNFTVLIDGRPSVLSGTDALRQLPASVIDNIEIITNPSAKYDPDGMAGIINIVMKKNILAGFNGIVNAMVGTGDKYRTDLTLNYRTKKSNLFFGADWNEDNSPGNFFSERETFRNDTSLFLIADGNRDNRRNGFNIRGGADLYLTEMSTLTLSGTFGTFNNERSGGSNLHEYTRPATINKYMVNNNISNREGNLFNTNINFQQKFNEQGTHKLDALFYFSRRVSDDTEYQDELLSDASFTNSTTVLDKIRSSENDISNNYRVKVDYVKPTSSGGKLEAGLQSTFDRESEEFNFDNFNLITSQWIVNPMFTSTLNFRRDIHAGYLTWAGKVNKLQLMAGLRGEYTFREIDHAKVEKPYTLNRFDLFPTGHLSLQATKTMQLMASYSRRINRPSGGDLDPFPNYMNQYTIRIGNPELKPEYTSSYQASVMQRFGTSFISGELFYRSTNNLISRIQELRDGIVYMTSTNVNRDYSMGTEVMGNFNITKWFLLNTSVSVFNYRIEGELNGRSIDRESTNYSLRMNGTFSIADNSRIQLTGFYRGPSVSPQGEMSSMFFTNMSYRQEFLKKKLTATLSVRDILGTGKFEGTTTTPDLKNYFRFERESQVVQLTLSYRINNFRQERTNGNNGMNDAGGAGRMDMDF
jgi:outer membrane receptor protein involved in Fe transport